MLCMKYVVFVMYQDVRMMRGIYGRIMGAATIVLRQRWSAVSPNRRDAEILVDIVRLSKTATIDIV